MSDAARMTRNPAMAAGLTGDFSVAMVVDFDPPCERFDGGVFEVAAGEDCPKAPMGF